MKTKGKPKFEELNYRNIKIFESTSFNDFLNKIHQRKILILKN